MRVSRRQKIVAEGGYLPLPEIEVTYLPALLFEIGPTMAGNMGEAPLSHGELRAWMDNTGIELQPWESTMLRTLSNEYLVAASLARKPDCPAPWQPDAESLDREAIARKVKGALDRFRRR